MNREYYMYWYQLDNKKAYLIWFSTDDKDGFVVDETGFIPTFTNIQDLQSYAKNKQIMVDVANPNFFDLDFIENWLNESSGEIENYHPFLDVWNLFVDISVSIKGNFDSNKKNTNKIYNKIFWGCNLPAVTPEGKSYEPIWTKKELKIIRETLDVGFQMFKNKVKKYE